MREAAGARGHEHDRTPGALGHHGRRGLLHADDRAREVEVDGGAHGVHVGCQDRAQVQRAAGAGEQGVDAARGLRCRGHGSGHLFLDGDVGHDVARRRTMGGDRRDARRCVDELLFGPPADRDVRAVGRKPLCGAQADAAPTAGHQDGPAGDPRRAGGVLGHQTGPTPTGALGVNSTGICSIPEMKLAGRRGSEARSTARCRSGSRASTRSTITLSSSRASWLPRQKWAPKPKAMWGLGLRVMSKRVGVLEDRLVAVGRGVEEDAASGRPGSCGAGELDVAGGRARHVLDRRDPAQHLLDGARHEPGRVGGQTRRLVGVGEELLHAAADDVAGWSRRRRSG